MEFRDYYEVLGVARDASEDDIRKAFRKLARKFHPDVAKDKAEGEKRFKEINEAYEVLGDAEKRRKYDQLGAQWKDGGAQGFGQPFEWGGPGEGGGDFHFSGTGFSDFFERFFGRHTQTGGFPPGGFPPGGPGRQRRGHDIEADLLVTLEEALRGGERSLSVRRPSGESRRVTVKIPAGVREGQQLRVRGHGRPGAAGGDPGDLFLSVRFEQHPVFRASGDNLVTTLDLAPWEAVLGSRVTLAALDGKVRLTVPPGTKEGEELVARGLGLPDGHGGRGDLRATVRIVVPSHVTPGEQAAWEALKQASSFHPRD